jgi:hypothetical protein
MAVIIGELRPIPEPQPLHMRPASWLLTRLRALFSSRSNPSPYPDRIWRRHSALLDAAWKSRCQSLPRRS